MFGFTKESNKQLDEFVIKFKVSQDVSFSDAFEFSQLNKTSNYLFRTFYMQKTQQLSYDT